MQEGTILEIRGMEVTIQIFVFRTEVKTCKITVPAKNIELLDVALSNIGETVEFQTGQGLLVDIKQITDHSPEENT